MRNIHLYLTFLIFPCHNQILHFNWLLFIPPNFKTTWRDFFNNHVLPIQSIVGTDSFYLLLSAFSDLHYLDSHLTMLPLHRNQSLRSLMRCLLRDSRSEIMVIVCARQVLICCVILCHLKFCFKNKSLLKYRNNRKIYKISYRFCIWYCSYCNLRLLIT